MVRKSGNAGGVVKFLPPNMPRALSAMSLRFERMILQFASRRFRRSITKDRHLLPNLGISKETIAPFTLCCLEDAPKRHRLRAELYAKFRFNQTALKLEHKPSQKTARIRVGYFSSDFYNHATMALMSQVFALHDKARFEVIIYSYGVNKDDKIIEKLMSHVSIFHDVSAMTDRQIVELARSEKLDLAVLVHPWNMMGKKQMERYWLPWLVGMPAETSRAMCSMIFGGIFDKFPNLRVNFCHASGSFLSTIGRIEHGFNCRIITYIKTS